jgi:hypothetical protein
VNMLQPTPSFRDWQPRYADHRIATFPVRVSSDGKVPAIRGWQSVGLPGSSKLAQKFAGADAFGFCPGRRSGLTILDIDTPDEMVLADALDRHGSTPVIVRSGSGNYQAWYRNNGEKRRIRRDDHNQPIDILGSGFVVAPPSRGIGADYQFIRGGLDDLDCLPIMRNIEIAPPPLSPDLPLVKTFAEGKRNEALFEHCMRSGHSCDDLERLLDVARTRNAEYLPPLPETEVLKIAKSAWGYTERGENRIGQTGVWFPASEANSLIAADQDAFILLIYLKANNGPNSAFIAANGLAETFGWTRKRLARARKRLEGTYLRMVKSPNTSTGPALYRWRSRKS